MIVFVVVFYAFKSSSELPKQTKKKKMLKNIGQNKIINYNGITFIPYSTNMKNKKLPFIILGLFCLVMIYFVFSEKKDYHDAFGNEYSFSELKNNENCEGSVDSVFICRKDCNKKENKNVRYCKQNFNS